MVRDSKADKSKKVFLLQIFQTCSGAHPASCSKDRAVLFNG
jgi:hypothetical protein